jgi:hypothetical protein
MVVEEILPLSAAFFWPHPAAVTAAADINARIRRMRVFLMVEPFS